LPVTLRLVAWYVLAIGSLGALHPLLGFALERIGTPDVAKTALFSIFPIGFMVAGPLWGWVADRTGKPLLVLRGASILAAAACAALAWTNDWRWMALPMALLALSRAPLLPLIDVLTVRSIPRPETYGRLRLWGSLAFVGAVWAMGGLVEATPRAPMIGGAVLLALAALVVFTLPAPPDDAVPGKPEWKGLLRHPVLAPMCVVGVLHGLSTAVYDYLFSVHIERIGLEPWVTSYGFVSGVGVEVVAMAFAPFLLARFGSVPLMLAAVTVSVPRWLITALWPDVVPQIAAQALHGIGFGCWWIGSISLLASRAPEGLRNSAQALFMAACYGVGPLVAMGLAAFVLPLLGSEALFLVNAGIQALAAAVALVTFRRF
jgi:PPP family 3-phenylpropionic acid transporter